MDPGTHRTGGATRHKDPSPYSQVQMLLDLQADPGHGVGEHPEDHRQEDEQFRGAGQVLGITMDEGPGSPPARPASQ